MLALGAVMLWYSAGRSGSEQSAPRAYWVPVMIVLENELQVTLRLSLDLLHPGAGLYQKLRNSWTSGVTIGFTNGGRRQRGDEAVECFGVLEHRYRSFDVLHGGQFVLGLGHPSKMRAMISRSPRSGPDTR